MKPAPRKLRTTLFNLLWPLVVLGNLGAAALNYVIWSDGVVGKQLYDRLVESGWGHYAVAAAALALAAVLLPAAYLFSLDRRRLRRPMVRLYLLWMSLAASAAGYFLGTSQVDSDNIPLLAGAGAAVLVFPLVPLALERVLGRAKIRAAGTMLRKGHAGAAFRLLRLGLQFRPSDPEGERLLGLLLAQRGRHTDSRPYLEEAYQRGERTPDVLLALAGAAEAEGNLPRAAELIHELHQVEPTRERMERLVRLWLAQGRVDDVLATLWALSPEERLQWADTLQGLLVDRRDIAGLRTIAGELERDGIPYNRSRRCYERLLDLAPEDSGILREAASLWERAGDEGGALHLWERLNAQQTSPDPEIIRRLIRYYERNGREADALRYEHELVNAGLANLEEKLHVIHDLQGRAELEKMADLVAGDESLRSNPKAATMLAHAYYDLGRQQEALSQLAAARELSLPADLSGSLASLEARIREQKLVEELGELAAKVEAAPDDLELRFEYLDRLVASKTPDKVAVSLEELLTRRPELQSRVIEEIRNMLERHGPSSRLLAYLADLQIRQGAWDEAFRTAEEVSQTSLHSSDMLHDWSLKILRSNPHHPLSLLAEAKYEARAENWTASLSRLEQYYQSGGERSPEILRLEMRSAVAAGQLERAAETGASLLELEPENSDLRMEVAEIALTRHRYNEALVLMHTVLQAEPERPRLQLLIRQTEERAREARIDEIRRQIEAGQATAQLHEELGDLLHDLGRMNEAIVEYQKASLTDQTHYIARAKLGYVLTRKSMYSDAEEEFARAELRPDQPAAEQAALKALFFSAAEVMADDHEEARALKLLKKIFHVDAGYRDTLPRIEALQRIVAKKEQRRW